LRKRDNCDLALASKALKNPIKNAFKYSVLIIMSLKSKPATEADAETERPRMYDV